MKCNVLFFAGLISSAFLVSCSSNEDTSANSLGDYQNGIFVVNEGNGTAGSISYIKNNFSAVTENIYSLENPGDGIGGYVQSIFFNGANAYIISNGSNKITVVNRYTFKLVTKITTGFSVPRYGVVVNGKAYVTNLGSFTDLTDDYISVIDLATNTVETNTIAVHAIADKITEENGKLYILNGNYGDGNTVTIIDPATPAVLNAIDLGMSPNSFEAQNGNLYVLCSNYTDPSKLVKINFSTDEIESQITFPTTMVNAQNLNIENNTIYFTIDSKVYDELLTATTISETPLFTSAATTLYGLTAKGSLLYISDAKDYASSGEAFIYSTAGILRYQIEVGLIPSGFYFN